MHKTFIIVGAVLLASGVLVGIAPFALAILSGPDSGSFDSGLLAALVVMYIGLPLAGIGIISIVTGVILKLVNRSKSKQAAVGPAASAPSLDRTAVKYYIAATVFLVLALANEYLLISTHGYRIDGNVLLSLVWMAIGIPLALAGVLGPLVAIILSGIGALRAKTTHVKLMAIAVLLVALIIYATVA